MAPQYNGIPITYDSQMCIILAERPSIADLYGWAH